MATGTGGFDQRGGLLDMDFDEGPDGGRDRDGVRTGPDRLRITARPRDVIGEGPVAVDAPRARAPRPAACRGRAASDVGDLEPDALLRPDAHHGEVAARRDAAGSHLDGDETPTTPAAPS